MAMYDDLVTPQILNRDFLHTLYDAAYMDCEQDGDGDSVITESGLKCIATLPSHQDAIHLAVLFPLKDNVPLRKKLECVNLINDRYIITRAAVTKDASLLLMRLLHLPERRRVEEGHRARDQEIHRGNAPGRRGVRSGHHRIAVSRKSPRHD